MSYLTRPRSVPSGGLARLDPAVAEAHPAVTCWKHRHPDRQSARQEADKLQRQDRLAGDRRTKTRVFGCALCGGYHVGRKQVPRKRGKR